ncbi:hypothetical protein ES332_D06G169900v1 [Gossypium tomentosum]|uniref:Uncharacterized protein n=1 Tax=Gossypium tomentosum TaxID=34277 RepID=A0A5D2KKH9_GOSTO|nr:hypothetical protein ES332_D06G169900v1 [Gossypium tomentosum]TYH67165.1 hypothetical protein ES332_D06G169900v1 [Gossypium tomentosum]TYH67166.1 hypothetical protein ES332_D06G169900v1 [Gossypium tomentosum]TYH67167.1 hypothetical protein ES332_D06G169900v1 [Gossypium tomentosum]TYH67168.1 hypothetical protein ES332_D06G169900v1 [Gossypium tomentosum]
MLSLNVYHSCHNTLLCEISGLGYKLKAFAENNKMHMQSSTIYSSKPAGVKALHRTSSIDSDSK